MVNNHGDRFRPLNGVIPLIHGRTLWLINGGDHNYLRSSWDDPPSRGKNLGLEMDCWNYRGLFLMILEASLKKKITAGCRFHYTAPFFMTGQPTPP